MANISRDELLHVARLARLDLPEEELQRLGAQLNDILAAVSKVSELDLSDVPATSHPLDVVNVCVVVFKVVPLASVIVMGTTGAIAAGAAATGVAAAAAVTVLVGSTTAVSRVCADASAAFSPGAAAFCGPGAGVGL